MRAPRKCLHAPPPPSLPSNIVSRTEVSQRGSERKKGGGRRKGKCVESSLFADLSFLLFRRYRYPFFVLDVSPRRSFRGAEAAAAAVAAPSPCARRRLTKSTSRLRSIRAARSLRLHAESIGVFRDAQRSPQRAARELAHSFVRFGKEDAESPARTLTRGGQLR